MSIPANSKQNIDDLSMYAPRRARVTGRRDGAEPGPTSPLNPNAKIDEAIHEFRIAAIENKKKALPFAPLPPEPTREDGLYIDQYRIPRSLEPGVVPNPWPNKRQASGAPEAMSMFLRFGAAAIVASIAALFIIGTVPTPWSSDNNGGASFASRFVAAGPKPADQVQSPEPHSLASMPNNEPVIAEKESGGAGLAVSEPAPRLVEPTVRPVEALAPRVEPVAPRPTELALAPRPADLRPADVKMPRPNEAARGPDAAPVAIPARKLSPEDVAMMIRRGEEFNASGDIAAARIVLQRAAEAHDARAAILLAGTYDPVVLTRNRVMGFVPDVAKARAWYQKAKDYGSVEAARRLETLPQ